MFSFDRVGRGLGLASLALWPAVAHAETLTYGPMLARGATPDTMIVRWGTQGTSDPGQLLWRKKGDTSFTTLGGAAARDHEVILKGLAAGTEYEYAVKSGTAMSSTYSFHTCPAPGMPMDVVFYGDSRSYPSAHTRVVAQVVKKSPEMVFESGDIAPLGTYDQYLSEFFPVVKDLVATTPFMATPGNHDAAANLSSNYGAIFASPRPEGQPWQPYYAFTCGNAMFIGLNSNDPTATDQRDWLAGRLKAASLDKSIDHVLVWFHHSAYSPGAHGDNLDVQRTWVPLFNDPQNKVTAVFSGHDHIYARLSDSSHVLYLVSGGAGAELYSDTGRTRATKVFSKSAYNFVALHIAGPTLSGHAYDDTGTELDHFSVTKMAVPPPDLGPTPGADGGTGGGGDDESAPTQDGKGCSVVPGGTHGGADSGRFVVALLGLAAALRLRRRSVARSAG